METPGNNDCKFTPNFAGNFSNCHLEARFETSHWPTNHRALYKLNNFQKTDGTLIIERVRPSDESKYVCIARNIGGVTEESFMKKIRKFAYFHKWHIIKFFSEKF